MGIPLATVCIMGFVTILSFVKRYCLVRLRSLYAQNNLIIMDVVSKIASFPEFPIIILY